MNLLSQKSDGDISCVALKWDGATVLANMLKISIFLYLLGTDGANNSLGIRSERQLCCIPFSG